MSIQLQSQTQDFIFPLPHFFVLLSEAPHHVFSPLLAPSPPLLSKVFQQHIQPGCPLPLLPGGAVTKILPASVGGASSIPGSRISPGEGNGNPLQYSCLENSRDRRAWRATVQGVTELDTTEANEQLPPFLQTDAESPKVGDAKQKRQELRLSATALREAGEGKAPKQGLKTGRTMQAKGLPDSRHQGGPAFENPPHRVLCLQLLQIIAQESRLRICECKMTTVGLPWLSNG